MSLPATGLVHGNTITLDAPVPPLEGKRVRVEIEPIDGVDVTVAADVLASAWDRWVASGPQGPIEDDDSDFPDATR